MNELTLQDADQVGGGFSFVTWLGQQSLMGGTEWFYEVAMVQID